MTALSRGRTRPRGSPPGVRLVAGRSRPSPGPWQDELARCDACVHLAGEPVAEGRWTAEKKRRIRDSRVLSTANVAAVVGAGGPGGARDRERGRLLRLARRRGARRDRPRRATTSSPTSRREWEEAARAGGARGRASCSSAPASSSRREGGALPKLVRPFKLFAGGPIGDGALLAVLDPPRRRGRARAPRARRRARRGPDERHRARAGAQPRPRRGRSAACSAARACSGRRPSRCALALGEMARWCSRASAWCRGRRSRSATASASPSLDGALRDLLR